MVKFKIGKEIGRVNWSTWYEHGMNKKNLIPWQETNPWSPEQQAGAVSTELQEITESEVI